MSTAIAALPASPAAIARASLPEMYEAARRTLSSCARVDECKEWADKSAALASYARQSQDETLLRYASRIRARAVRRTGVLLQQVESSRDPKKRHLPGRSKTARAAGLTRDQQRQAMRVAALPDAEFEREIETERPASVVKLARLGIVKRPSIAVPEDAIARAKAQLRLKALLGEIEECAADIDAIASAAKYFGGLLLRNPTLRDQVKHAGIFFAQLNQWMSEADA